MSVTRAQVQQIAELARLTLSEEETTRFAAQLATILDHALELDLVAGDARLEKSEAQPEALALWADEPPADALSFPTARLAPAWRDGFFTVPRLSAMQADAEPDAAS